MNQTKKPTTAEDILAKFTNKDGPFGAIEITGPASPPLGLQQVQNSWYSFGMVYKYVIKK